MGKKKADREEVLAKKRAAERLRREKIKNDPTLAAIQAEKQAKWNEKKKEKQKKMTNRQRRELRKKWRKKAKEAYERKKIEKQTSAENVRPGTSCQNSDGSPALQKVYLNKSLSAMKRERRRAKISSERLATENRKLAAINENLQRKVRKFQMRLLRMNSGTKSQSSPKSVIKRVIKRNDKKEIARRLLFGETMRKTLKDTYSSSTTREKALLKSKISPNFQMLKKYRLLNQLNYVKPSLFNKNRFNLTNSSCLRTRMTKLTDAVRADVKTFFEQDDNSRICPGKKDCITRRKIKKQKRFLLDSIKNLHAKFCQNSSYKLSYSTFCRLRPFWVLEHQVDDRNTVACKTHANIEFLAAALHKAGIVDKSTPKGIAENICCDTGNISCLRRQCNACKDLTIPYFINENKEITYSKWITVSSQVNGKTVKNVTKTTVAARSHEAVDSFDKDFLAYLFHESIVIHQFRKIKELKIRLDEKEVLIHCDFSENYSMKYANEIQSFHFGGSRKQYTLHTVEIYYKKNSVSETASQSFCTLSEYNEHGPVAVWAHLQHVFEFIKKELPRVNVLHFLSDCPATQYRNRTLFYLFSRALQARFENLKIATWNYGAPGHGKGAPDGIGGCLKRTADRVVALGNDISDFRTFVEVLQTHTRRVRLAIVEEDDVTTLATMVPTKIPAYVGSMKVHQVVFSASTPDILKMNSLSCFSCYDCEKYILGMHKLPSEANSEPSLPPVFDDVVTTVEDDPDNMQATIIDEASLIPGVFLLVKFSSTGKNPSTSSCYSYVCCIERAESDGKYEVQAFQSSGSQREFVTIENDVSQITKSDILEVLPNPSMVVKRRKIVQVFAKPIDVKEKNC